MNSITQKNGKTKQTDYVLTPMLDELVRNVEFLGENVWFPSGAITILGGRKRCGKSTLALYECARFSAMGKKVLIVQREDDAGLVKAKLQCMGADLGNIMLYKRRAGGIEYCGFNAGDLRGIVESAGKMHADLVYIDPLHGLAAGRMNDQQSADCLIALDAMAKRNNCCVLGVTILAVQDYSAVVAEFGFGLAYAEALVCAAGAGVGFLVAMLLFCGVRQRVERSNPPESFKGLPITLVSAAITAMSFMGFGGLVENIIAALM